MKVASPNTFALNIQRFAKKFEAQAVDYANRMAIAIQTQVVGSTPVDTSKALSNWILTLNIPHVGVESPYVPGTFGSSRSASMREAIDQATTALVDRKYGQLIYISNSTPYISDLNNGTSRQAPSGFFQTSILVGRRQVRYTPVT